VADLLVGGRSQHPALKVGKNRQPAGEWRGGPIVEAAGTFPVSKPGPNNTPVPAIYPKSGQQIWGLTVAVQTAERDPAEPGDDGVRTMFIDGAWKDDYSSKRKAVIEALRKHGAPEPQVGGQLYLRWTHEVNTGGAIPALNWEAHYVPAPGAAMAAVTADAPPVPFQAPQPYPAQPAPVAQPQYQQPTQPQYQQPTQPQYPAPMQQAAPPQPVSASIPASRPDPAAAAAMQHVTPEMQAALLAAAAGLGAQQIQATEPPF
jgi:hypothetical protein